MVCACCSRYTRVPPVTGVPVVSAAVVLPALVPQPARTPASVRAAMPAVTARTDLERAKVVPSFRCVSAVKRQGERV